MSNDRDPWLACYQALLAWVPRWRYGDLHRLCRTAVERSLVLLWGRLDPAAPATDADVHAIVATVDAYHQGWFDAVLGTDLHQIQTGERWPLSLWQWADAGFWSERRGRGRVCRETIGDHLDLFATFRFAATLAMVADAADAAQAATGDLPQRAASAAVEVLTRAWSEENRAVWNDAPWYDRLEVEQRVGWAVAALERPELTPSAAAGRAYQIAEQGRWDGRDGWTARSADALPTPFLAELAQAVSDSVRESLT